MKSYLSCYYYPTTILCVDDDADLLSWLESSLSEKNKVVTFDNAQKGIDFLKAQEASAENPYFVASSDFDKSQLNIAVNKIHELIYTKTRFNEVSTLVVDYSMPGMDGLSFCRSFAGKAYKKIMLTGQADQTLAINAFNEGVIDQFVAKGQTDALEKIQTLIHKMQWQFFIEKSLFLVESLLKLDPQTFSYFTDADFCEKLTEFLCQKSIKEAFLFNEMGDYLLIDAHNKIWWLSILNLNTCDILKQEAKIDFLQDPSPEAEAVYKSIESGKKLPLFALSKASLEIEEWQDILVSPTEIKTIRDTYQVLLTQDIGKAALRYQDIQFL